MNRSRSSTQKFILDNKTMNSVLHKILHSNLPTIEKKKIIEKCREQESKIKDSVYDYFKELLKDDPNMMEMARRHYDSFLSNDPDYSCFEDWFKDCVYDMSGNCWKEGVEYWLGELKYQGKFEQYLEDIKFQDFLDHKPYECNVHFCYSDGSFPGDVWSMMIDPKVHIEVELLNWM